MADKLDRMQFLRVANTHGEEVAHAMACASVGRTTADLWKAGSSVVLKNNQPNKVK